MPGNLRLPVAPKSLPKRRPSPTRAVAAAERPAADPGHGKALSALLNELIRGTMDLHNVIADVFLNHQAHLSTPLQPYLKGFPHGV